MGRESKRSCRNNIEVKLKELLDKVIITWHYCYQLNCVPQNKYVWVLTLSTFECDCTIVFGTNVFIQEIKLKWYIQGASNLTCVFINRACFTWKQACLERNWSEGLKREDSYLQVKGLNRFLTALRRSQAWNTLRSAFCSPEIWGNKLLLLKSPSWCYFVWQL